MIRTGTPDWALVRINHQIAAEKAIQDAAAAHGLHCWMRLGPVAEPARRRRQRAAADQDRRGVQGSSRAVRLQGHRRAAQPVPRRELDPPGRAREGLREVKALDPAHPLVIIQAPRGPVSQLIDYRPAFDITGVDIFPVAYPPGLHCDNGNTDISVVGDMTDKMVEASGGKPVWMTLQIAWSGTALSKDAPEHRAALPVAPRRSASWPTRRS